MSGEESAARAPLSDRVLVSIGTLLVRILGATWRVEVRGGENLERLRAARRPILFSLWHGMLLPLLWQHRNQGVLVVISEHRDGERIAMVAQRLGYGLIRGSTTRGGGRALIRIVRTLQDERDVAITPDGPRGPAKTVAQGIAAAALRSSAHVVPVGVYPCHAWRLGSWDKFAIPKPFSRVVIAYATPLNFEGKDVDEATATEIIRVAMLDAEALATQ
jgi:lysophospholipid acyltransferase (LPLAT)-like uncharacterized protein